MNRTTLTRRITAAVSGPLVATGIMLGSLVIAGTGIASAQPTSGQQCTGMAMTDGQGGSNPNPLTRAGQIGAATGPGPSDGSMAVDCQAVSHG